MASNKVFNFGPVLIADASANLLSPNTPAGGTNDDSSGLYIVLRHIRIVNNTGSSCWFSLWRGATGASVSGTEVVGTQLAVPANSAFDWYGIMRFDVGDFFVGEAQTASALTIQGEGEVGVV